MPRKPVPAIIQSAARSDILRQHAWYRDEQQTPRTAARFLDSVQSAIESLRCMPEAGAPKKLRHPLLAGLRSWPVDGFPAMRIYYLHRAGQILIVRVLDGRRDLNTLWDEHSSS
jgi:toxin ParE1/3/4